MSYRHLGYACINQHFALLPKKQKVFTSRTTRLKFATLDKVSELSLANVKDLHRILLWNALHDIKFFRVSSELFPFYDHPDFNHTLDDFPDAAEIRLYMSACARVIREYNMKIELHPAPYNCLGSPNSTTVDKTIMCLEMHALVADLLEHPACINIHVGGTYGGDFIGTADRFCKNFDRLSDSVKSKLTVENDDKESMWSVSDLHKYIYNQIEIPIVLDFHHFKFCNDGESVQDAADLAFSTWDDVPTTHHSESAVGKKPQAHSDYITYIPEVIGIYDVMIEAKQKELALLNFRKSLDTATV